MDKNTNSLNWFELAVTDFNRAKKFYETIFGITLQEMEFEGTKMGMFPSDSASGKLSGAICQGEWYKPSAAGVVIYFNGDPDLQIALDKVEAAGGQITRPKTPIGEFGFMAMFIDTEGNHVALHSNA